MQGDDYKHIQIGNNTSIGAHTILGCWNKYQDQIFNPQIIIGNNCTIGEYCQITATHLIQIGDGILTGRYVYIGDNAHGGLSNEESTIPPVKRKLVSKGGVCIGKNVWIGDRVSILGGVTIGDNVIIGAGAVVTHNIPSNSLVAGMPAKVIKRIE